MLNNLNTLVLITLTKFKELEQLDSESDHLRKIVRITSQRSNFSSSCNNYLKHCNNYLNHCNNYLKHCNNY